MRRIFQLETNAGPRYWELDHGWVSEDEPLEPQVQKEYHRHFPTHRIYTITEVDQADGVILNDII